MHRAFAFILGGSYTNLFHSVHYQQTGPTPNVVNVDGNAGERGDGFIAYNSYCGSHVTSSRATCASCHVGGGQFPTRSLTEAQLVNLDCLLCHQDDYRRTAAPPYQHVNVLAPPPVTNASIRIARVNDSINVSWVQGQGILSEAHSVTGAFHLLPAAESPYNPEIGPERYYRLEFPAYYTIQVPTETETGFYYVPDESAMPISILEAARTVHLPTRASCLRCHATAGGRDGGKRGDMSSVTAHPPLSSDVHMSDSGAGLTCVDCHYAGGHRFVGRGLDLRPNDADTRLTCAKCHTARPHGDYSSTRASRDGHAAHVACQTCHIPRFARDLPTEMARDWQQPRFDPAACSGQGGWAPSHVLGTNMVPVYNWFDGTSKLYVLGQSLNADPDGSYGLARPNGSVNSTNAQLFPMKKHTSVQARHRDSGEMIPHSTFVYFTTASFENAIASGQAQTGLIGSYDLVPTYEYQTVNHGVVAASSALACANCHGVSSGYGGTGERVMWPVRDLGYALKGTINSVCSQCHGFKTPRNFRSTHEKHVRDSRFDCAWCHTFSRPERGLRQP